MDQILFIQQYTLQFKNENQMDGARFGSYYNNSHHSKRKKIEVTTTINKVQPIKRQFYFQSNPYSLNKNPSTPILHRTPLSRESSSNRDTLTQTSSQKSGKMVRANGLIKAEKPNISNSRALTKTVVQKLTGSHVGPAISPGFQEQAQNQINYPYQPQMIGPTHMYYATNNGKSAMHSHLQEQNSNLKMQNINLREQLFKMEVSHSEQINSLHDQINRLFRLTKDLQDRISAQDNEWQQYLQDCSRK